MRLITIALAALLILIQYPLWLGKDRSPGWLAVHDMEAQVDALRKKTDELKARNAKLDSEVRDLKDGTGAVEERARYELGMIKQNEIFIQVLKKGSKEQSMTPAKPLPDTDKTGKPLAD
jgi:cell division protein FtsB